MATANGPATQGRPASAPSHVGHRDQPGLWLRLASAPGLGHVRCRTVPDDRLGHKARSPLSAWFEKASVRRRLVVGGRSGSERPELQSWPYRRIASISNCRPASADGSHAGVTVCAKEREKQQREPHQNCVQAPPPPPPSLLLSCSPALHPLPPALCTHHVLQHFSSPCRHRSQPRQLLAIARSHQRRRGSARAPAAAPVSYVCCRSECSGACASGGFKLQVLTSRCGTKEMANPV